MKHLDPESSETLPSFIIDKNLGPADVLEKQYDSKIQFPFVIKPDVGQRGFGVRIVKNKKDLYDYLKLSAGGVHPSEKKPIPT